MYFLDGGKGWAAVLISRQHSPPCLPWANLLPGRLASRRNQWGSLHLSSWFLSYICGSKQSKLVLNDSGLRQRVTKELSTIIHTCLKNDEKYWYSVLTIEYVFIGVKNAKIDNICTVDARPHHKKVHRLGQRMLYLKHPKLPDSASKVRTPSLSLSHCSIADIYIHSLIHTVYTHTLWDTLNDSSE